VKVETDKNGYAEISFRVRGDGIYSILKILRHFQRIGGMGHSYSVVLDPDNSDYKMSVGWDGDGSDHVDDIKVNGKLVDKDELDKKMNVKLGSFAAIVARITARIAAK
jgi:hypothetical protein